MYFTKSFKNLWNYTRNLLTIWNFTQSKIILHKRCLRCLWQILCLNRLPWSHLNHTFVPFAISSITLNGDVNDCVLNMTQGEAAGAGQLDLARDHRLHYFHNLGEDLFGAVQCVHMSTFRWSFGFFVTLTSWQAGPPQFHPGERGLSRCWLLPPQIWRNDYTNNYGTIQTYNYDTIQWPTKHS